LLPATERLAKRRDFAAVYARKRSWAGPLLVLYVLRSAPDGPNAGARRFGFSISRKVGKAHDRNRVKRRLRAVCRLRESGWKQGFDVIVVARTGAAAAGYDDLDNALCQLMTRAGLNASEARRNNAGGDDTSDAPDKRASAVTPGADSR
jgi:ribonuclease P protein component